MTLTNLAMKAAMLGGLLFTGVTDLPVSETSASQEAQVFATGPAHLDLIVDTEYGSLTQTVYFASTSAELSDAAQVILSTLAADLQALDVASIRLQQESEVADDLFLIRAHAVASELANAGFPVQDIPQNSPSLLTTEL